MVVRGSADPQRVAPRASALLPAAGLPLLYFGFAHACLALAFAMLAVSPELTGGFFYHPRMIAVVHLVTLGWISGSILGAFYIVAPLVLRMPLRPGWRDRIAFGAFAIGVAGMVSHFWIGEYSGMVWSAVFVAAAVLHVAVRAWIGLWSAPVPWPVKLHVALAFANFLMASLLGMVIGLNRVHGWLNWSQMSAAFAHAHLATLGWAVMMVIGLSYRLIPMILPGEMPKGRSLAVSAVLIEVGTAGVVMALLTGSAWSAPSALVIAAGIAAFVSQVMQVVRRKLPAPPALPRPDWAAWQAHVALVWFLVAMLTGLALTFIADSSWLITLGWIYGTAGLVGFLTQMVVGVQGRILPMYAWYRTLEKQQMQPPPRSAHTLASPGLSKAIFMTWTAGVLVLVTGLATGRPPMIAIGSGILLAGVLLNAGQIVTIVTAMSATDRASLPRDAERIDRSSRRVSL